MFKKSYICFFALMSLLLSGCASVQHVPLSQQDRQTIKAIYVNPTIKKPKEMYEFASGSEFGFAFGAVGGLISGIANENAAASTQEFAEKSNINIQKIVYQQWMKQLESNTRFKLITKPSDTILATEITLYGISIPHGFSTDYIPVLAVNATLTHKQKIIWQDSERVMPGTSGMPRYKMDEILNDPKKLYIMWDKASEKVMNEFITDMNKQ